MSSEHQNPEYTDVFAVVAGMERMSDDLLAVPGSGSIACGFIRRSLRPAGSRDTCRADPCRCRSGCTYRPMRLVQPGTCP